MKRSFLRDLLREPPEDTFSGKILARGGPAQRTPPNLQGPTSESAVRPTRAVSNERFRLIVTISWCPFEALLLISEPLVVRLVFMRPHNVRAEGFRGPAAPPKGSWHPVSKTNQKVPLYPSKVFPNTPMKSLFNKGMTHLCCSSENGSQMSPDLSDQICAWLDP